MVEEEWSPAGGLATRNSLVSEVSGDVSAHRTVGRQLPTKVEAPYTSLASFKKHHTKHIQFRPTQPYELRD